MHMVPQDQAIKEAVSVAQALLTRMGFTADISPRIEQHERGEHIVLWFRTDHAKLLIGAHGAALASLEHLIRVLTQQKFEVRTPLITIDINGYRAQQEQRLKRLADRALSQVRDTRTAVELKPMSARERRVVHTHLSDYTDIRTESTGQGKERRIVIHPETSESGEKVVSDALVF